MSQNIDFSKLTPIEFMFGECLEQAQEITALFEEAELYLSSFRWCDSIKRAYFGLGVSDFIGIFLFEIEPSEETFGRFHWVVSGDVPSACIGTADCPNSAFALHKYIGEKKSWCNSMLSGDSVDGPCTSDAGLAVASARALMTNITLLETVILKRYSDELA